MDDKNAATAFLEGCLKRHPHNYFVISALSDLLLDSPDPANWAKAALLEPELKKEGEVEMRKLDERLQIDRERVRLDHLRQAQQTPGSTGPGASR
jgi:hypothetical protein